MSDEDLAALRERGRLEGWTFTVERNPATKYSLEQLCGIIEIEDGESPGEPINPLPQSQLASGLDWRLVSGDIPVKNQGGCGSCWAFAGTGAFEWAIKIRDGLTVDLSEQWLVSCNQSSWGCGGGSDAYGLNYYTLDTDPCNGVGAVWETDFPYAATELPCDCPYDHPYLLKSWGKVGATPATPTVQEIKTALSLRGPICVGVFVDYAFAAYSDGIFNACANDSWINHAVVLVGWDDTQGSDGVWIMRNSWGPGWGENGYMRIEYGCSRIGQYAAYVEYDGPVPPELDFSYPQGIPDTIPPHQSTSFQVSIHGIRNGIFVPGSERLHYQINGEPTETVSLTNVSAGLYEAVLPRVDCDDQLEFYMSAEEVTSGRLYDPEPETPHTVAVISEELMVFADNFVSDQGWTVSGDAVDGLWVRGIPLGYGDCGQPTGDFDGSNLCYLTGNAAGDSDVDGGTTALESPIFDLSDGDALVCYARWYSNDFGDGARDDVLEVYISNDDGGNWTLVETVGPGGEEAAGGWVEYRFWVSDYLSPTDRMRLRFTAADLGEESVVEAAIDAVRISAYSCYGCECPGYCDLNRDGAIDPVDVAYVVTYVYRQQDSREQIPLCSGDNGDWDCDGGVTPLDVAYYVNFVYKQAGSGPGDPCSM